MKPFRKYANRGRARMVRMLSSMPPDRPVGTWCLLEALYGRVYVTTHDTWHTHHMARKAINHAEKYGYIRMMPYSVPSSTPSYVARKFGRAVAKEKAWAITEYGQKFLDDYRDYMLSRGVRVRKEDMPYTVRSDPDNYVIDRDFR